MKGTRARCEVEKLWMWDLVIVTVWGIQGSETERAGIEVMDTRLQDQIGGDRRKAWYRQTWSRPSQDQRLSLFFSRNSDLWAVENANYEIWRADVRNSFSLQDGARTCSQEHWPVSRNIPSSTP